MTTLSQPAPATPAKNHRFHFLDALRGVAAIVVVFWHAPPWAAQHFIVNNGLLAVDFFFCLSGFVIAFAYERRLLSGLSLRDFFAARMIRLYPIYLLGTVLGIFVFAHSEHTLVSANHSRFLALLLAGLLFLPNIKILTASVYLFPFDDPAWSLFFEILANLAYAALVRFRIALKWIFPALAAASFLVLLHAMLGGGQLRDFGWPNYPGQLYLGFARVGLTFSLGVCVLQLYRAAPRAKLPPVTRSIAALLLTLVLLFALIARPHWLQAEMAHLFIAAVVCPAIVLCGTAITVSGPLAGVCSFLGDISYPLYLLHISFLSVLHKRSLATLASTHNALSWVALPGMIAVLFVFSYLAGKFYDVPLRRFLSTRYASFASPLTPTDGTP